MKSKALAISAGFLYNLIPTPIQLTYQLWQINSKILGKRQSAKILLKQSITSLMITQTSFWITSAVSSIAIPVTIGTIPFMATTMLGYIATDMLLASTAKYLERSNIENTSSIINKRLYDTKSQALFKISESRDKKKIRNLIMLQDDLDVLSEMSRASFSGISSIYLSSRTMSTLYKISSMIPLYGNIMIPGLLSAAIVSNVVLSALNNVCNIIYGRFIKQSKIALAEYRIKNNNIAQNAESITVAGQLRATEDNNNALKKAEIKLGTKTQISLSATNSLIQASSLINLIILKEVIDASSKAMVKGASGIYTGFLSYFKWQSSFGSSLQLYSQSISRITSTLEELEKAEQSALLSRLTRQDTRSDSIKIESGMTITSRSTFNSCSLNGDLEFNAGHIYLLSKIDPEMQSALLRNLVQIESARYETVGNIFFPTDKKTILMPQFNYLAHQLSLIESICYPDEVTASLEKDINDILSSLGPEGLRIKNLCTDKEILQEPLRILNPQEQKIAILVSSLIKKPDILLLDNALISLEESIQESFLKIMSEFLSKKSIIIMANQELKEGLRQKYNVEVKEFISTTQKPHKTKITSNESLLSKRALRTILHPYKVAVRIPSSKKSSSSYDSPTSDSSVSISDSKERRYHTKKTAKNHKRKGQKPRMKRV